MLTALSLRNFVIVESLDLEAGSGMTTVTGETGAGKSILIDAVKLLLGGRADSSTIRSGKEKAEFSATFSPDPRALAWLDKEDWPMEPGEDLVLRRTIDRSGRSRGWINGMPASIHQLRDLGRTLVAINGQHAYHELLDGAHQLALIDAFADNGVLLAQVQTAFDAWHQARKALEDAQNGQDAVKLKMERMDWMLEELNELSPKHGEWERINAEHSRLSNRSNILEGLQSAFSQLSQSSRSALDQLSSAQGALEDVSRYDPKIADIAGTLGDAISLAEDANRALDDYLSRADFDEETFEKLDARVGAYFNLSGKYKCNPEDLFDFYEKLQADRRALEEHQDIDRLKTLEQAARDAYCALADELTTNRKTAAADFSALASRAVRELDLPHAAFLAEIVAGEASAHGQDQCVFRFASHPSLGLEPLAKSASGGELSRLNLAIAVINPNTLPSTVIFDEADVGIGGAVAERVGKKLRELAKTHQVLCITHLPQIAGFAQNHWKVKKTASDVSVASSISVLTQDERVSEIARMLSGEEVTDAEKTVAKKILRAS